MPGLMYLVKPRTMTATTHHAEKRFLAKPKAATKHNHETAFVHGTI
jgi:hypothetical protein